jgi:hypothetical protein
VNRRDVRSAAQLYRSFREARPRRAKPIRVELPSALAVLGTVEFIGYVTTHGGRTHLYIHEFAPGSRPKMCAGGKRRQLFFAGGRYRLTARGIVDLDASGREVHARGRYQVLTK